MYHLLHFIPHLPVICWWASRLNPESGYCEWHNHRHGYVGCTCSLAYWCQPLVCGTHLPSQVWHLEPIHVHCSLATHPAPELQGDRKGGPFLACFSDKQCCYKHCRSLPVAPHRAFPTPHFWKNCWVWHEHTIQFSQIDFSWGKRRNISHPRDLVFGMMLICLEG